MLSLPDGVSGMDRILNEDTGRALDRSLKDKARQRLEWGGWDTYQGEKLEVPGIENQQWPPSRFMDISQAGITCNTLHTPGDQIYNPQTSGALLN